MAEHKKYQKTGIVIIIGAILVLIMRLYILSAILFLIGLIAATYPFIKKNTNEMSGLDIEDSKCNCENCDSKGCNTNCDCNNLNCDNIDSEVISNTSDSENITNILTENDTAENKEIELETPQNTDVNSEIEDDMETDINIEPEIDAQHDISPVIEVDFENGTKSTTDANSLDDEDNSEVDTIIDDNEKDDE